MLHRESGERRRVPAAALFIFIGAVPRSEMMSGLLEQDEGGFILTGPDLMRDGRWAKSWKPQRDPFLMETSVPGIFAGGDVRHGAMRRVASAGGDGAVVVSSAHQYLKSV